MFALWVTGLWGALLNHLSYCVLNLLPYIHSFNTYPFVCLGIHFFFLFTDARIHVYLLIYFLIYSVGFCLSGQAPSLLWHVHHTAFRCWQAAALSRPVPAQLRRRTIIHHCPPSSPVLIVLRARHHIIGGRHQIISEEWTMKCHMTTVIIRG